MSAHLIISRTPTYRRAALLKEEQVDQFYVDDLKDALRPGTLLRGKIDAYDKTLGRFFVAIGDVHPAILEAERGAYHVGQWVSVQVTHVADPQAGKGCRVTHEIRYETPILVLQPTLNSLTIRGTYSKNEVQQLQEAFAPHVRDCGVVIKKAGKGIAVAVLLEQFLATKEQLFDALHKCAQEITALWTPHAEWVEAAKAADHITLNSTEDYLLLLAAGVSKEMMTVSHDADLFESYNIEEIWESLFEKVLPLQGGGSLVFEQTAALMAIDVNTGGAIGASQKELRHFNLDIIPSLIQQIKWRNLSGAIVIDFAGLVKDDRAFQKKALDQLHLWAKGDPLRIVGFTRLGLLELTRPRYGLPIGQFEKLLFAPL